MEMYCGIDLHATNSWLCVVDEVGQPLLEARVPNRLEAVRARLEPYREQLSAVAVESTFNWYWLVDGLSSSGYPMRLANPSAMQRYEGLKYSDDRHDARWIAEMLRPGSSLGSKPHPPPDRGGPFFNVHFGTVFQDLSQLARTSSLPIARSPTSWPAPAISSCETGSPTTRLCCFETDFGSGLSTQRGAGPESPRG